jgi:hypothetical protein
VNDDAGMREVFRGDLPAVELAAGLLEEQGIEFQRRWEQAGGASFIIGDTALLPGRTAVLLVPSVAFEEAKNALASFEEPEPEFPTELSGDVAKNAERRRNVARVVVTIMLAPMVIAVLVLIVSAIAGMFR